MIWQEKFIWSSVFTRMVKVQFLTINRTVESIYRGEIMKFGEISSKLKEQNYQSFVVKLLQARYCKAPLRVTLKFLSEDMKRNM